jgi:hypothetical protein
LGSNTRTGAWGGEIQDSVKLDLYKVDFTTKDSKGNIAVSQVWTKELGAAGSQTEALYNPRMFVYNDATKELVLPIVLANTIKTQQCSVSYDTSGKEIKKDCYPSEVAVTEFAGVKAWNVGVKALTETLSVDYSAILKAPSYDMGPRPMDDSAVTTSPASQPTTIDPWVMQSLMPRVGYNGNQYYMINMQFAHFFTKANTGGKRIDWK